MITCIVLPGQPYTMWSVGGERMRKAISETDSGKFVRVTLNPAIRMANAIAAITSHKGSDPPGSFFFAHALIPANFGQTFDEFANVADQCYLEGYALPLRHPGRLGSSRRLPGQRFGWAAGRCARPEAH